MANITAVRDPGEQDGKIYPFPVKASTKLWSGAAVLTDASGWLDNAADTTGTKFAGIMDKTADNSAGANGAIKGRVIRRGVFDFVFGGTATQATVGKKVYASDNQTVNTTTTNSILVGTVVEVVSATKVRVEITPAA